MPAHQQIADHEESLKMASILKDCAAVPEVKDLEVNLLRFSESKKIQLENIHDFA